MRFLYTGATKQMTKQSNPDLSLGGYCSNTIIPNGNVGNIFPEVSYEDLKNLAVCTKGIVLENESANEILNYKIGYRYPTPCNYKLEFAFVELNNDSMEKIDSDRDTPYSAVFQEANVDDNVDNSIEFDSIKPGQRIGAWIRRMIVSDTSSSITCAVFPTEVPLILQ